MVTGGPFGRVSAVSNVRPYSALTPSALNRSADASPEFTRRGRSGAVRFACPVVKAPTDENAARPLLELEELRRRDPELIESHLRKLARDVDQPIRLRIAERPQDDGVDHREDRGVRADAERERQDRDDREAGRPRQIPRGVANITNQSIHRQPPPDTPGRWLRRGNAGEC